jgi:hypothetical protein
MLYEKQAKYYIKIIDIDIDIFLRKIIQKSQLNTNMI